MCQACEKLKRAYAQEIERYNSEKAAGNGRKAPATAEQRVPSPATSAELVPV